MINGGYMKINIKKNLLSLLAAGTLMLNASNIYAGSEANFENDYGRSVNNEVFIQEDNYHLLIGDEWYTFSYNDVISYAVQGGHDDYTKHPKDIIHYKRNDLAITNSKVNFRVSPDVKSRKITSINYGTRLEVIAKTDNNWYLVIYDGVIGYVDGKYLVSYLDVINDAYPNVSLEEIKVEKVVYSTSSSLNIRCGNSKDYPKIGSLKKYESALVLKEIDGWYLVITNDNVVGFVDKSFTQELTDVFVVIDLSDQRLWLYEDNELLLSTSVVTGTNDTPTRKGLFKIYSKQTNRYLTGEDYHVHVNYWMPFDGGIGMHDASWRKKFGDDIYIKNGSHGCVNIPSNIADDIYEKVEVGTKVLVHK